MLLKEKFNCNINRDWLESMDQEKSLSKFINSNQKVTNQYLEARNKLKML